MATRYVSALCPDGTVVRRRTERDYTHAVLIQDSETGEWSACSYHGSFRLGCAAMEKLVQAVRAYPKSEQHPYGYTVDPASIRLVVVA